MKDRFLNSIAKRFQLLNKEEQLPMPDEALWGAISESIQKDQRKRRLTPVWWLLGIWALFLTAGISIYYHFPSVGDRVQLDTLSTLTTDPIFINWKTSVATHLTDNQQSHSQSDKTLKKPLINDLKEKTESIESAKGDTKQRIESKVINNKPSDPANQKDSSNGHFTAQKTAVSDYKEFNDIVDIHNNQEEIHILPSRELIEIQDINQINAILDVAIVDVFAPELAFLPSEQSAQAIILQAGSVWPLYTHLKTASLGTGPQLLENIESERRIYLGVQKQLTDKWQVGVGLQYASFDLVSQYNVDIHYASAQEQLHGNTYSIALDHTLPTSLGEVQTTTVLGRSSDTPIQSTELVGLDISYTQRRSLIQIPFTASYRVRGGLHFFAGLTPGITLSDKLSAEVVSHHSIIDHHNSHGEPTKHQGEFSLQSVIGVGYTVPIANRWTLGANIGLQSDVVDGYYQTTSPQSFSALISGLNLGYRL